MTTLAPKPQFRSKPPDPAGVITWVHFGDLYITKAGAQNHLDLALIVDEVNQDFAVLVSFVFSERDQDNALDARPEHGLLETQLGPDQIGKK